MSGTEMCLASVASPKTRDQTIYRNISTRDSYTATSGFKSYHFHLGVLSRRLQISGRAMCNLYAASNDVSGITCNGEVKDAKELPIGNKARMVSSSSPVNFRACGGYFCGATWMKWKDQNMDSAQDLQHTDLAQESKIGPIPIYSNFTTCASRH